MFSRRAFAKSLAAAALAGGIEASVGRAHEPVRDRPFVVDAHVHFGADGNGASHSTTPRQSQIAEIYGPWSRVYDSTGKRVPRPDYFDTVGDADKLVGFLDRMGIDVAVIFPFAPNRVAQRQSEVRSDSTNEAIAGALRRHPNRFIGLCGHDPFESEWEAPLELKRRVEKDGFKGMKLYPPYYKFDPADRDLDPLYKMASDIGAVLTFHTGWTPLKRAPTKFGGPQSIDDVALRFPDLQINMAHAGGPALWPEAVLVAARHKNVTMDISSWCGYPPSMLVELLNLARDLVGLDRVLYGSEHTLCRPDELIRLLANLDHFARQQGVPPFSASDIEGVLGLNAARLFRIDATKRS